MSAAGNRDCNQCGEPLNDGAARCHHCGVRQDPWWSRVGVWWMVLLAAAVITGGVVWWNAREDQREQDRLTDEYVCAMTGDEDCS